MFVPLQIEGTGQTLPKTRRLSSDIDQELGRPAGWMFRRTGVFARHIARTEDQVDMAVDAAAGALSDAGLAPGDVDLLLFTASVPYQNIPATAPLVQRRLGIADGACAAFDISATCLGFLSALDLVAPMLAIGRYRRALIVASEIASRALPWADDPETAGLFGDGAAAAVVTASGDQRGIVAASIETHPSAYEACRLGSGGTRYDFHADPTEFARHAWFEMDGAALFRTTIKGFPPFLDRLLAKAGWQRADVDLVVPHQASPGALAHLARRSGFRSEVVVDIMRERGNQVAASLPSALHLARTAGRMPAGSRVLLLGTSAGVSFGGLALVT